MNKKLLWILLPLTLFGVIAFDSFKIFHARRTLNQYALLPQLDKEQTERLKSQLNQKFTFLAKGSSHAAFESEDGTLVVKLFLNHPITSDSSWRRFMPGLTSLSKQRKYLKRRIEQLGGCINAYTLIPHKAGLLYYHFAPTDIFHQKIQLVDERGGQLNVDLDRAEYYVQRKATLSGTLLRHAPIDDAKRALTRLYDFTLQNYQAGIKMVDLQLESNFGFLEDRPIRIDVEHITCDRTWKKRYHTHLDEQLENFQIWLEQNRPELIEHLELLIRQSQ